jgi:multiple sugar transport system substrate-binding protein
MRKKRSSRVLSILMAVMFLVALVVPTIAQKGIAAKAFTKAAEDKTTIIFWALPFEDTSNNWLKKWVDEYNKTQSTVEIKLSFVPGDAWDQKIKAAQASGNAPDISFVNYNKIADQASRGLLMPMDQYTKPAIWQDLLPNVDKFVTVNGKHYAYPQLVEPSAVLYYRKDLMKKAGLDPNKPPTTWKDLLLDGRMLTKKNVFGLGIAGMGVDLSWTSWGWQAMMGHMPISNDWSKATITDNNYVKLVDFWKDMYSNRIVPKQALTGYTDMAAFGQGRLAMQICGSWGIGQLRNDYKNIVANVGVAPVPTWDGNQKVPTATLGGWTLAIDGKSKHPQQAADFISWIFAGDTKIMLDFFKTSKFSKFPVRKSVVEVINKDTDAASDPVRKIIAEQIVPYAVAEPIYAWDISMSYANAVERVILKGAKTLDSLKQAEKEINSFIARNKYAGTNPNK